MSNQIGSLDAALQQVARNRTATVPSKLVDTVIAAAQKDGSVDPKEAAKINALLSSGKRFSAEDKAKFRELLTGASSRADDALAAMVARLKPQKKLNQNNLKRAEEEISDRYGPDAAREVLAQALGTRVGDLTADGQAWVREGHGNMNGHLERFEALLQSQRPGAQLIDANFNGQLDADDQYLLKGAGGRVKAESVGAMVADRVKVQAAMVGGVEAMLYNGAPIHRFAIGEDQQFNPALWEPSHPMETGAFKLKEGVKPSDAMNDIFTNPGEYQFDCATAVVIVTYKAMLDLLGPKDFDRACASLKIGPWVAEKTYGRNIQARGKGGEEATQEHLDRLQVGDQAYIQNWDATEAAAATGWPGENVIVLGDGLYYGHPFGIATLKQIVGTLDSLRTEGSTRSASFTQHQERLMTSILKYDQFPGE